jgi:hypothetical protein
VLPLARHHLGLPDFGIAVAVADIVGEIAEVDVAGALGAEALGADPEVARREGRRRLFARQRRRRRCWCIIIIEADEERVGYLR